MLWKESYNIGVETIDQQHKQLFDATEGLIKAVRDGSDYGRKRECIQAIIFLKNYVLEHFSTEEFFQASISYPDIQEHKKIHKDFIATMLSLEKRLVESDFDLIMVKQLTGFLTSWLIYHVAGLDQKLTKGQPLKDQAFIGTKYANCFSESITNILKTMTGLNASASDFNDKDILDASVYISIELIGEVQGKVTYTFMNVLVELNNRKKQLKAAFLFAKNKMPPIWVA